MRHSRWIITYYRKSLSWKILNVAATSRVAKQFFRFLTLEFYPCSIRRKRKMFSLWIWRTVDSIRASNKLFRAIKYLIFIRWYVMTMHFIQYQLFELLKSKWEICEASSIVLRKLITLIAIKSLRNDELCRNFLHIIKQSIHTSLSSNITLEVKLF